MDIYIASESKNIFLYLERNRNFEKNYNLLFNKYIKWFSGKIDKERIKNLSDHGFNRLLENTQIIKNNLKICSYKNLALDGKIEGRIVVGLGGAHVAETSITLHHIYGIPYIPGSALKGVTRHYCLRELFKETKEKNREQILCFEKIIESEVEKIKKEIEDENKFKQKYKVDGFEPSENIINWFKNNENNLKKMKEFQNIFGTQDMEGKVIFMDSYPKDFKFKIDIMNPHYSKYYNGETPPADYLNPVPIFFLVLEDSAFIINLFSRDETLLEKAAEKLEKALTSYGIGAKTSLGYGMFQKVEEKKDSK